ncbi:SDR family NAD(P)-dependent oxidoreductase [Corallococcus sp. Z5C101001]|uniref:SDR family NAD(P)-dependent oxidoreductase n=1 Tax=Corallococcus sp. Z5C101001 TaxID=2596829 RepID=UPI0011803390|nr:SDR family NAD(P)-dependent oxidoreductase [Corallococcus sp. Z5C101001]TSC31293.1 SDR family NAD(P)-dependent oxidoreductase [Corallococcus sp. Z5C101001]
MPDLLHAFECSTTISHEDPLVRDHRVHGVRILPGVVFLDLVLRALKAQGFDTPSIELRNVLFSEPIATTEQFDRRVRLRFVPQDAEARHWRVTAESSPVPSGSDGPAGVGVVENFRCEFQVTREPFEGRLDVDALLKQATRTTDVDDAYVYARGAAIEHLEFMKGQGQLYFHEGGVLAALQLSRPAREHLEDFLLHPVLLDSSTLLPFLFMQQRPELALQPFIPIHIESFRAVRALGERVFVHVRESSTGLVADDLFHSDIDFYSREGQRLASLRKLSTKRIRSEALISRLRRPEGEARAPEPRAAPAAPATAASDAPILDYLRGLLASELSVAPESLDETENFYSQGLDSTHLLRVVRRLEQDLACKLYPTLLFEHSTLRELADYLSRHHAQGVAGLAPRQPPAGRAETPAPVRHEVLVPAAPSPRTRLDEPIAIIGLAGRYPQAADLDAFWDNLQAGRDCITEVPKERWNHDRWFDPNGKRPGTTQGKWGGFLQGIDQFDARLFNLSPREVELMDPQERLFLETAWQALEDSGQPGGALRGQRVGVFVGVMWGQYALLGLEETLKGHPVAPSSFASSIANRVSYFFDFRGPSLSLDTMCSSSLTALHLARESLLRGECEQALVGGVNLMLHPSKYVFLSEHRMLSSDGRCRAFGEGGSGYVPGEGVGAVLLKPLSRAEADGDFIHGVIRTTAVNHGGRSNGYTVPDPDVHATLISEALERSGVEPGTVGYIEAHGTGTSLGDPIEISGLGKAFRGRTAPEWSCAIGSVKSNVGHLEAAAGIAGITKVLLQLRHRKLAPSLHARQLNPFIDFASTPFRVQQELSDWPAPTTLAGQPAPRRAGLSSFGAGGANAHVILEEYVAPRADAPPPERPRLVVLSALKEDRLRPYAERLLRVLDRQAAPGGTAPRASLSQIAYSSQIRGEPMPARLAFVASSLEALRVQLRSYLEGTSLPADCFQGTGRAAPSTASLSARGTEAPALRELAARWVEGQDVDWSTLHPEGRPRRHPLPTYPFAWRSYWLPRTEHVATSGGAPRRLHPLLGLNTSTFAAVRFSTAFSATEPLLADHRVRGQPVLPGVVCLEMALAAARLAGAGPVHGLRDITWASPGVPSSDTATLDVSLELQQEGEHLGFRLVGATGQLHAQGRLSRKESSGQRESRPAPGDIQARCPRLLSAEDCYRLLASRGLEYGESLRPIRALHVGHDEALAALHLPTAPAPVDVTLPPGLLDGALQAVIGLLAQEPEGGVAAAERTWLPFSLTAVHLHRPLPPECFVHVTRKARRKDVETFELCLLDGAGTVLVRMEDFAIREVRGPAREHLRVLGEAWVPEPLERTSNEATGALLLFDHDTVLRDGLRGGTPRPVILVKPGTGFRSLGDGVYEIAPARTEDATLLLQALRQEGRVPTAVIHAWTALHGSGPDQQSLEQVLEQGLQALISFTRTWLQSRPVPSLQLLCVEAGDETSSPHAALSGFCKTINREHGALRYRVVRLGDGVTRPAWELLLQELSLPHAADDLIRLDRTGRARLRMQRLSLPDADSTPLLRHRGVYLITGGRGGLGLLFARFLAQRFQARLVLAGRAPEDAAVRDQLQTLAADGAEAVYLRADVSREDEAQALVNATVSRFGALHGVIHSAGVLRDAMVAHKRPEDVTEVLRPKVHGALHLDLATRQLPLDFFVLFSSLAGVIGNVGQCDYAFANRYLDQLARRRAAQVARGQRHGRSLSIAWPLWREGGMRVDAQVEQHLLRTLGMKPLGTRAGLDFFVRALHATEPVMAVVEGDLAAIDEAFALIQAPASAPLPPSSEAAPADMEAVLATVAEVLRVDPAEVDPDASLEDHGFDPTTLAVLSTRLGERMGRALSSRQLAEHASVRALCQTLAAVALPRPSVPAPAAPPSPRSEPQPVAPNGLLRDRVRAQVMGTAASILKMDVGDVDPDTDLRDFGFDSISMTQLANRLREQLGVDLTAAMLFEHDRLGALVEHLLATHREALSARFPEERAPPSKPSVEVTAAPEPPKPQPPARTAPPKSVAGSSEPIAIIGMGGLFAQSPELGAFWRNLEQGRDLIAEIPPERWDWRALEGNPLTEPNRTRVRWGSFIDPVEHFDAAFFRITPREAALMDPQHRLFLQLAWNTLEDAGYRPSSLAGSDTGVFVGIGTTDYHDLLRDFGIAADAHTATGKAHSVLPNRLSFLLDLHGPSLPVETACSSSLVAIHHAVQALRSGQCTLALVGGVNLLLSPQLYFAFSRAGMLSEDGRCKTFDASANGYVRGEGLGALLLKPLSRAEADGDTIHAVIRGTAINHGGRAQALTAPNPKSQADLLVAAYEDARVDPATVGYIEAHGTGTSLGDPIEISGLRMAFERLYPRWQRPPPSRPHCALGSVKTNIGHLETAAGIAGVLKVALALRHRTLPASLHFQQPNPQLRLEGGPFYVNATTRPWPAPLDDAGVEGLRRAGVSSFGFGGTNAHVVLEEYRAAPRPPRTATRPQLVVLSARDPALLRTTAERLREALRNPAAPHLEDLAYTLTVGREVLDERLATVVRDLDELAARLDGWLGRGTAEHVHVGSADGARLHESLLGGAAGAAFLEALFTGGELDRLARLWVSGATSDLSRLYPLPSRRVSLPGSPFAQTRHWLLPGPADRLYVTGAATAPIAVPETAAPRDATPLEADGTWRGALQFLTQALATTARLDPATLRPTADFESYGMNSILIAELHQKLEAAFGKLPITLFFKYKNLADLAAYLGQEHGAQLQRLTRQAPGPSATTAPPPEGPPPPAARVGPPEQRPRSSPMPRDSVADGDIAIIGMSGRYPQAEDLEHYWRNLETGKDCIEEIPTERWDYRPLFDATRQEPGSIYAKWGGFLDRVDRFDAAFFQISPLIARYMDPQERLFLETAWACMEDAGYTRAGLAKADAGDQRAPVGVFVGATYNEYALFGAQEWSRGHRIPFSTQSFSIANRVSYALNLSGPSLTLDTACSSSLNAIHLACESLRSGACEVALAGGVNLSLHPSKYVMLCANRFASSDGRCRSFAAGGDGYVPGEGVGAVLLKPLAMALRDGDTIHAVIKGSAHNHDGKTHGYTVPNPVAQTEVISTALRRAGVDARTLGYVEAHGTGTSLGDPIEVTGLTDAFRSHTPDRGFCAIGSVKASIGHLESAAGIAQLHKVLLQMRHRRLAPTLIHGGQLNPHIDFASTPFRVQREATPWHSRPGEPLRAGISSFGAGGVNVHLVVESWEGPALRSFPLPARPQVLVLSARTPERLRVQARRLLDWLEARPDWGLGEFEALAFTLQQGREAMSARLAFVASDLVITRERLRVYVAHAEDSVALRAQGLFTATLSPSHVADAAPPESELLALVARHEHATLARTWAEGTPWPWRALYREHPPRRLRLPTYPFAGERHWIESSGPAPTPPPPGAPPAPTSPEPRHRQSMREQLAHAPQAERHALLISLLGEAVARVLAYAPSTQPSPEEGFFDLGMESVQATQLVEHLEGELGIDLYPTLAFDHPTLRALADFLLERLPAVAEAPAARRAEAPAEVVLARQEWRDAPCTESPGRAPRGVLLVGGSEAHARAFREHLHAQGVEVPVVGARLGQRFDATGAEPEFDPADARQVQQLLAALSGRGLQPSHVFHLGALDADFGKDPTLGFAQLLGIAQGMLAHTSDGAMRLGYLHATVDGTHRPAHAALGGFCRALGLEAPRLGFQTLALGPESSAPSEVARLALANSGQDDVEIRYVADRRQVRELVEPPHAPPRPSPLRQGGAYLLTGGAGGLGLLLAEHLVRTVQARIALMGRGELDEARRLRLEALRGTGAQVFYIRADVSDRDSAARGLLEACERLGTVHGIIHAAGATRDSLVAAKDPAQWAAVLGPKVHGTLHLDEASRHLPLDFFALFSSTAAITGNVGQSDYAFANAFLDAFAEEREARRARGERRGRTVSFNWPLWAEGGMRVDASTLRFMERRGGLTPLPTALGLSVFEAGLAQDDCQRVVFHGARDVLVQRFGIRAKAVVPEAAPPSPPPAPAAGPRSSAPTPEGREPIAIIGMACRFPGGCDSPEALWRFLMEGGDAIVDVPRERWDPEAFFNADPDAAGRVYVRQAGFLKEAPALFDARLFGISPREAIDMDPQQRLLLEVSWEALERAGLAPDSLAGSPVGVFVGMGSAEYGLLPRAAGQFSAYSATGLAANIASGRISHRLGLQGPALTVDTACSSSLMAVHLACDSLLRGESTVALAGGVNLMLSPYTFVSLSRLRALAPDGRCKTFDASADGYGRAEGGGMIVLKRLADARRDGDPVLAVLLGSAANHDGASSGLTVPNGLAQQALLRKALESAHLEPQRISYVEAHGTGTSLGDPIEMQALGTVYGQRPASAEAFTVGAVKAHLGHLEAAAGIAGLIKTVLCLQHRTIPKQPHLHQLNPHIRLERMRARLAWDTLRWDGEGRAAGVSAFGFSGTNVHVIVAEPPAPPAPVASPPRPVHLLPLSARDDAALRAQARAWREYLSREPEHLLGAACTAAVAARSHLEHRAAVVASDGAGLAAGLLALAEGHGAGGLLRGVVEQAAIPRLALAIPHAGDLRATVAALSPVEPVFAAAFDACGAVVAELSGGSPRMLEAPEVTTFRARYALLKLLGHWGYQPDALLADGLGLYLAACEAGVLELRDALRCLLRDLGGLGAFTLEPGQLTEPRLRLLHTRTDALIDARKAARADTWTQPALATGDWEAALAGLASTERRIIVALGDTERPWLRATSDEAPWRTLLDCVADLYTRGLAPARRPFTEGRARPERPPPTYPFQRKPYWLPTLPVEVAPIGTDASGPPVFDGTPLHSPRREREFAYRISYARLPELADNHGVAHVGHLQELLTRAIRQHLDFTSFALRDVRYLVALHVDPHEEREVRLGVEPLEGGRARLLLHGRVDERGPWTLHAQAVLEHAASTPDASGALPSLEQATRWDGDTFYRRLEALSFDLGESVKWVDAVDFREGEALARFRPRPRAEQPSHALGFHPGILDACAQLFAVAGAAHLDERMRFMVVGWESFQLHHAPASDTLLCHITFPEPPDANGNITGHFRLLDEANRLVAEARGHRLRLLSAERVAALEKALQDTPRPQGPRSHEVRDAAAQHAAVVAFLTGRAAHHLQMEQDAVTPHVPLRDLGLDSITGLSLRRDIEETLSLRVPAELLLEGPSIDNLTRALLRDLAPAERAPDAVPPATAPHSWFSHVVRRPRPRVRLFCFPYGGGGASLYLDWARLLPEHIEVWPIQLPGRETRIHEPPLHRLEDLLPQLESALRPHLDLPFAFYGHSLGALLAYLLASRLRARGLPQPEHLLVGGASAPFLSPGPFLEGLQQRFRAAGFQGVPDPGTREPLGPLLDIAMNTAEGRVMAGRDTDFARALLPMMLADLKLMEGYRYQPEAPFAFPITVMHGASDDRITAEASSAWRALTQGAFHQHVTPGDHFFLRPNQAQAWLLQRIASALPPLLPTQASPLSA